MKGAITEHIDVAQVVLYAFWLFFAGLIFYLRREDRREGYPLVNYDGKEEPSGPVTMPTPKIFRTFDGRIETAPRKDRTPPPMRFQQVEAWEGSPIEPVGDPMLSNVGPGSYVHRADVTDKTAHGQNRLAPLRLANDYYLDDRDPDPRGMEVVGADGVVGGVVRDIWVDRSEFLIRYLEVEVSDTVGVKTVLLPMPFAQVNGKKRQIKVVSILGSQFGKAPALEAPDQITLHEEDKVAAYYGGGILYAEPSRLEPLI